MTPLDKYYGAYCFHLTRENLTHKGLIWLNWGQVVSSQTGSLSSPRSSLVLSLCCLVDSVLLVAVTTLCYS